jgi:ribosomal protein S18 acetylase RimI-like enzyme
MPSISRDGASYQERNAPGTVSILAQLISIWAENNPDEDPGAREQLALQQTKLRGFRCFTATTGADIVGFAYGMYGSPGGAFVLDPTGTRITPFLGSHDMLVAHATKTLPDDGSEINIPWLDAYEVAEVQVRPAYQNLQLHIGTTLVRKLCESLPVNDRVILTVEPGRPAARHVYESIGFKDICGGLVRPFLPPHTPQIVLGLERAGDA